MPSHPRLLLAAVYLLLATATAAASQDCPRHVQSVLMSQQYDECVEAIPSASFVFSKQNAHAVNSNEACESTLRNLLAVMPSDPCTAVLTTGKRALLDAEELRGLAHNQHLRRLMDSYTFARKFTCKLDLSKPFNSSDPGQEFSLQCNEGTNWNWLWLVLAIGAGCVVLWGIVVLIAGFCCK